MRIALLLIGLFLATPQPASADTLVADLSNHLIAINSGFDGDDVLMFGSIEGPGDIVVVVRGPEQDLTIRRKERISGIWVNNAYQTFEDVPAFYAISSTRQLTDILPDTEERKRHAIGFNQLPIKSGTVSRNVSQEEVEKFRTAIIRNKQRTGLYRYASGEVTMISGKLFRAPIHFPANVAEGIYRVEVYHVRGGEVVSAEITPLSVSKVGVEFEVYDFATRQGLLYGIFAVIIACFAGWLGSAIFRKR